MMKPGLPALLVLLGWLSPAGADDTKAREVKFEQYSGYFESNMSGLKGEGSYLAFTSEKAFTQVLRPVPPLMGGKRHKHVPREAFEKQLILSVIKRGSAIWLYSIDRVTAQAETLTVYYKATSKETGGTASFASPLVLSVEKGTFKEVVFVENSKKVGTAKVAQ